MITNRDKAECARREVKQRVRVYPRLVADGRMTAEFAARQLELMEAIAADYEVLAADDDARGRLL